MQSCVPHPNYSVSGSSCDPVELYPSTNPLTSVVDSQAIDWQLLLLMLLLLLSSLSFLFFSAVLGCSGGGCSQYLLVDVDDVVLCSV